MKPTDDPYGIDARDRTIGNLRKDNKQLKLRVEALDELLVCYRVGKRPSEQLFAKLEKSKQALKGGE